MLTHKAYKFRIYPNNTQRVLIGKQFGCGRVVYNHFLQVKVTAYKERKEQISYNKTSEMLTQLKKLPEFVWLNEIVAQSLQQTLTDLDMSYSRFFRKISGFPNFRKKSSKQSFRVPQNFKIQDKYISLPKMGAVKAVIDRKIKGRMLSITVSKTASGKYFASVLTEQEVAEPTVDTTKPIIGIDFGLHSFLTTSDGVKVEAPKFYRKAELAIKRAQRKLSKKKKGSQNRKKARFALAKKYEAVANKRKDFLHKLSRKLVSENQAIWIENLSMKNMGAGHNMAKAVLDCGWYEFTRQLAYKGQWYSCQVNKIDRFFPSSKTCNVCGLINDKLKRNARTWSCEGCKTNHDRDINAAKNILMFGSEVLVSSTVGTTGSLKPAESKRCKA